MPKLLQWNSVPYDSVLSSSTNQFLQWLQQSVVDLQASSGTLPAPVLSTTLTGPTAVRLQWTSVTGAAAYNVYESSISGVTDKPVATIAANNSLGQNDWLRDRAGIGVFFYAVQAIAADGKLGLLSAFHSAVNLPENVSAIAQPPGIVVNYNMSADVIGPDPFIALERQALTFVFGQQGAGGFLFTWPSNVASHGTIAATGVSIQNFVCYAGLGTNGTLLPTSAMIFM